MPRVTITVPESTPQPYRFDLFREVVTIGRGEENDIIVGCGSVSGKHSEMRRVKGGYHLIDMGSTNGIKFNGSRHQTLDLSSGMLVKLGDVEFNFTLSEEEQAELASEVRPVETPTPPILQVETPPVLPLLPQNQLPNLVKVDDQIDPIDQLDLDEGDGLPELPPIKKSKAKPKKVKESTDDKAVTIKVDFNFGFYVFAIIAVIIAFVYGANMRHKKDTGDTLLKGMVNKEDFIKNSGAKSADKAE